MPHPRHLNYKGYAITTSSAEIGALPGRLARFDGFFRVERADKDVEGGSSSWRAPSAPAKGHWPTPEKRRRTPSI